MDILSSYKRGIEELLKRLGQDHRFYKDALTFQDRLSENIYNARKYGPSENLRFDRARILDELNSLAQQTTGTSFNKLCGIEDVDARCLRILELFDEEQLIATIVREFGEVQELEQRFVPLALCQAELPHHSFFLRRPVDKPTQRCFSPDEILDTSEQILILGDAGIGKTTVLSWIALKTAILDRAEHTDGQRKEGVLLPLYVPLQRYPASTGGRHLEKLLCTIGDSLVDFRGLATLLDADEVFELLRCLPFLLLLDGLNDIPSREFDGFLEGVSILIKSCSGNRHILTSRKYRHEQIVKNLSMLVPLELTVMSFDDSEDFIRRYRSKLNLPEVSFEDFDPRIRHLGQTPLYLRFILELYAEESPLAHTNAGLISGVMQKRLEWEHIPLGMDKEDVSSVSSPAEVLEWKSLLVLAQLLRRTGGIAPCFDTGHPSLSALPLIEEVVGDRGHAQKLIDNWHQKQILRLSNGDLKFWHPVFQTFLVAVEIAQEIQKLCKEENEKQRRKRLIEMISNETQREALAMAMALIEFRTAREVVQLIIDEDTVLASMCLDNLPDAEEARAEFIRDLHKTYSVVRIDYLGVPMLIALVVIPALPLIPYIGDIIGRRISYISASVSPLILIGGTATVAILLESSRVLYGRWVTREFVTPIARALGNMRFPDAAETLDDILSESGRWFVVEGINHAVAQIQVASIESIDELAAALDNPGTKTAVIAELVGRGSEPALRVLMHLLSPRTERSTLEQLLKGLLRFAEQDRFKPTIRSDLKDFYVSNRELVTWATRIQVHKVLKLMQVGDIPKPWPHISEIFLRRRSSGFKYLELAKGIASYLIYAVLFGILLQLLSLLIGR